MSAGDSLELLSLDPREFADADDKLFGKIPKWQNVMGGVMSWWNEIGKIHHLDAEGDNNDAVKVVFYVPLTCGEAVASLCESHLLGSPYGTQLGAIFDADYDKYIHDQHQVVTQ